MSNRATFNDPIYSLACRLRPDLRRVGATERIGPVTDILGVVVAAPLCLVGLSWLTAVTDLNLIAQNWLILLLIGVMMFVFDRLRFFAITNLGAGGGAYGNVQTTLTNLVKWSAVFIFGPTVLWLDVLLSVVSNVFGLAGAQSGNGRWNLWRNLLSALVSSSLFPLLVLELYRGWGGSFPPQEPSLRLFLLGAVVGLVELALEFGLLCVIYLSYSLWVMRKVGMLNVQMAWQLVALMGLGLGVPYLSGVFAILLASLYAQFGVAIYLIFVAAALLVAVMSRQLGQAIEESRQQSLQLEKLEEMGRSIVASAPEDTAALSAILSQFAPEMFTLARLAIWTEVDGVLVKKPEDWDAAELLPVQQWLAGETQARAIGTKEKLPWQTGVMEHHPLLVAPVLDNESGQPCGGLYVELMSLGRAWDSRSLAQVLPTAQSLTAQVAAALQQRRAYARTLAYQKTQQELALARRIQADFLPRELPELSGWGLSASLEPARQMSGDFYDLIPLANGHLGLLIADVTDKGVGPALFMALSRTLIRTYAVEYVDHPERVLKAANQRILQDAGSPLFVTAFYGVLDPQSGQLIYANAGHNPPLLFKAGQAEPQLLIATGMPLAVEETMHWEQKSAMLEPGDLLFLYTDGATDAQNSDAELFSFERLTQVVAQRISLPSADLHAGVVDELRRFIGEASQYDDITLMVVKKEINKE
ncbi:MAG: PP2C family protein-serine/threonine phosphatase [Anaerolineales bacterium]|nr:PP2C family protein-serine/threonine phosphatase [Anaerolineales bacterium]